MISITPFGEEDRATWQLLVELSRLMPDGWTVIGAQMVVLHGFEHGRSLPRSTVDVDVLVNIRLIQDGTHSISRTLIDMGFVFA